MIDYVNELEIVKNDIKAAIREKGVTVSGGMTTYASKIRKIGEEADDNYVIDGYMNFMYSSVKNFSDKYVFETRGNIKRMFLSCAQLETAPYFKIGSIRDYGNQMFYGCKSLKNVPLYDFSNFDYLEMVFMNCESLEIIPCFNTSGVGSMVQFLDGCKKLKEVPAFNTTSVWDLVGFIRNCTSLKKINELDFSNVRADPRLSAEQELTNLTDLEGFINFGKGFPFSNRNINFLYYFPNLTKQSLLNVINKLYNMEHPYTYNLKLHPNHLVLLTDEEIALATNKGWTIS